MITVGVLALQGDVREHARALESVGARVQPVRRERELKSVDAIVIPGGESTTMWKLAAAFDLLEPLRAAVGSGMPAYGSCAGMIMLADRLEGAIEGQQTIGGMDVTVRRNAFGRQVDSFEIDHTIGVLGPEPLRMVFIRAPWVEQVGPNVEVLAQVEGEGQVEGKGQAAPRIVAIRQGALLATSFHPEVTGDTRVHHYFVHEIARG